MGPCWACAPSFLCSLLSFYHSPSLHPRGLQTWLRHSSSAPCQSICIVARCSHCHARQSVPVSGITQLDGGHGRGHPGPPRCTKTVNLTTPSPAMTVGQETNLCVRLCLLAVKWIQSSWTTLTYLPDKQFVLKCSWSTNRVACTVKHVSYLKPTKCALTKPRQYVFILLRCQICQKRSLFIALDRLVAGSYVACM